MQDLLAQVSQQLEVGADAPSELQSDRINDCSYDPWKDKSWVVATRQEYDMESLAHNDVSSCCKRSCYIYKVLEARKKHFFSIRPRGHHIQYKSYLYNFLPIMHAYENCAISGINRCRDIRYPDWRYSIPTR